jgi:predicted PurR-regulated permease PerM
MAASTVPLPESETPQPAPAALDAHADSPHGKDQDARDRDALTTDPQQVCALADEVQTWELHDVLLAVLVVLASFYTIYFTRSILFPVTLAVLLNLVFKPIVLRLERVGIHAVAGATLILLAFGSVVLVGVWLLWEPGSTRLAEMSSPGYLRRLSENLKPLQQPLQGLQEATETVSHIAASNGKTAPVRVQIEQPKLGSMLNLTGGLISSTVMMLVLLFFLLASGDRFLEKLVVLMPTFKDKRRVVQLSREVQRRMSDYLFTISAINVGLGVVVGLGMWLIELPNPVLWGTVAALLNYIPFAGSTVGAVLVFLEGVAAFNSLGHAALAPLVYIGINALEANFITPAMLGKSISLNPVMIVLSIVFWGWLWGIGGVLLSVPLLVVLKIVFDHSQRLAPVGAFLER